MDHVQFGLSLLPLSVSIQSFPIISIVIPLICAAERMQREREIDEQCIVFRRYSIGGGDMHKSKRFTPKTRCLYHITAIYPETHKK